MNVYAWVLLTALAVAALADWVAVARGRREVEVLAKPAVLVVLLLLAWLLRADTVPYGQALLVGLGLSLCGDIALLGRSQRHFLAGLACFLAAHLAYVLAFLQVPGDGPIWPAVVLVVGAVAAVVRSRVLPRVRAGLVAAREGRGTAALADAFPLLLYAVVIGSMTALAWATGWVTLAVGATLFLVSDAVLAYDRFERPVRGGRLVVMVTYHLGQTLIVLGALRG